MSEETRVTIREHPVVRVGLLWVGFVATAIVGFGIWTVWKYVSIIGFMVLGTAIVGLVCVVVNVVVFTLRNLLREDYYDIGAYGTRVKSLLGRPGLLAPMAQTAATNAAKIARTGVQVNIPTLFDLLDLGEIHYGMTDMILGYLEGGQVIRGRWPNTFAVAGKGRSGKTRRVVFMLVQALMAGAYITVCDPHYNKHDSLTRELEPLAPWLHFAGNPEEIMNAATEYLDEMQHRENTRVDDDFTWQPRLIVFDEWSRLMTRIEKEDTEKLIEIVTAASQEYAGFNGYACIIGQSWIDGECGGTKIRRALHAVFVHRIDTDYAKFLIKPKRWHSQTEQLVTGHCLYQDLDGKITRLVMPFVEDRAGVRVAEILRRVAPLIQPEVIAEHASASTSPQSVERENIVYLPEVVREVCREVRPEVRVSDEDFISVLREIGKRIKAGETPNDIRKSLGITGGRALQEVNAALNFLQEHTDMEAVNEG